MELRDAPEINPMRQTLPVWAALAGSSQENIDVAVIPPRRLIKSRRLIASPRLKDMTEPG
jgi:hypothetical protein